MFRVDNPRRISCITLFLLLNIAITTAHANSFNKGSTTATISLGSGSFFDECPLLVANADVHCNR